MLFHDHPGVGRGVAEIADLLYVPESVAGGILAYLCEIGCLAGPAEPETGYRFAPRDAAMQAILTKVVAAYRSDMIDMTHLIHNSTQKNAQRFADAFKLKKGR